ncbi:hypothetical protein HYH03_015833 [Edaphochlamys debaryana]|uniref:Uncharacterized protein n=1 Tax=Edaphochlamys debaryana TaxID=47281 RepID=A0A836BQT0_9CHLO|nr:hypothetical protein HYH03_015833 [Edaphochlamys debaryana]|eukprot:KAG2485455.1 hypothetical protein HYH03_015833 [Edaphochlamys debaryana]
MVKTLPRHRWKDEKFRKCMPGPLSSDSPVFPPPPDGRTYVGWYGKHSGPSGSICVHSKFAIPCPWAAACGPSCGAEARCLLARRQGAVAGETVPVVDLNKELERFLKWHLKSISDPVQREQERACFFKPNGDVMRVEKMVDQDLARIMSKLTWGMLCKAYPKTPGPRNVLQTHLVRFHGGRLPPQLANLEPMGTTSAKVKPWAPTVGLEAAGGAAEGSGTDDNEDGDVSEEEEQRVGPGAEEGEEGSSAEVEDSEDEKASSGRVEEPSSTEESSEDDGSLVDEQDEDAEDEQEECSEDEGEEEEEEEGEQSGEDGEDFQVPAGTGAYGWAGRALPVAAPPSERRQGSAKRPAVATTAPAAAAAMANGGGEPRPLKRQRNTGPGPAPAVASPAPAARQPGARAEQGRGPEPGGQAAADAESKRREAAEAALAAVQRRAAALEHELAAARVEVKKVRAQAAEEVRAREAAEERFAAEQGQRKAVEALLRQERARVRKLMQAASQGGRGGAGAGAGQG